MKQLMLLTLLIGINTAFADLNCGVDEKLIIEKLNEEKVKVKVFGYKEDDSGMISKVPVLLYHLFGYKKQSDDGYSPLYNQVTYSLTSPNTSHSGELKIIKSYNMGRGGRAGRFGIGRAGGTSAYWDIDHDLNYKLITANIKFDNFEKTYGCLQTFP